VSCFPAALYAQEEPPSDAACPPTLPLPTRRSQRPRGSRRPAASTLLDVFQNMRDDEGEHVATMAACQDKALTEGTAPKVEAAVLAAGVAAALAAVGLQVLS